MPPKSKQPSPASAQMSGEDRTALRRHQLIGAARSAFLQRGYAQTGIADITEPLGLGRGTFYRYYESKRDILDAVVDDAVERVVHVVEDGLLREPIATPEEFLQHLRLMVGAALGFARDNRDLARVLVLEMTSIDEEFSHRVVGLLDMLSAMVASWLEELARAGVLRSDLDASAIAGALLALIVPALALSSRGRLDSRALDEYEHVVVSLIARGLAAPAP